MKPGQLVRLKKTIKIGGSSVEIAAGVLTRIAEVSEDGKQVRLVAGVLLCKKLGLKQRSFKKSAVEPVEDRGWVSQVKIGDKLMSIVEQPECAAKVGLLDLVTVAKIALGDAICEEHGLDDVPYMFTLKNLAQNFCPIDDHLRKPEQPSPRIPTTKNVKVGDWLVVRKPLVEDGGAIDLAVGDRVRVCSIVSGNGQPVRTTGKDGSEGGAYGGVWYWGDRMLACCEFEAQPVEPPASLRDLIRRKLTNAMA